MSPCVGIEYIYLKFWEFGIEILSFHPLLSLGCQRAVAVAAALTSVSRTGGEKKGSASNLTVGFTRNAMHQSARCTRPNFLYYILTVGRGDKVSNAPFWWALVARQEATWRSFLARRNRHRIPKLLTLLLPGCSSL